MIVKKQYIKDPDHCSSGTLSVDRFHLDHHVDEMHIGFIPILLPYLMGLMFILFVTLGTRSSLKES
jgi:hypothetical protein